ncbi:hypothetical protein [Treponema sp.]|uniref:hypothetical protein n=1 Tax=Treponema sp. TaxID=166 RepID=UPI0025F49E36|nr:hypothetical protein [Treponema sp.]MCR5218762.1 hypothetical protein [Treponema sp.]
MKKLLLSVITALIFMSCSSTKTELPEAEEDAVIPPPPPVLTELPVINYSGKGIRYEVESMLLNHFIVMYDEDASKKYCARLNDEGASAQLKVKFPAGTYECMLSEKAPDGDHSAFYLYLDGISHRIYPSDPPLGTWELTSRVPVYFTIEEPRTILITIQANSKNRLGHTGMSLDYIQFVKRD